MSIKLSPAIKGLITAAFMIVVFLVIYKQGEDAPRGMQYLVYSIYGLGIIWTLLSYRQSASFTGKFGDIFSQGFKCFVVITLCVALFYGIFNYMHPEFREEMAVSMKETLLKSKDALPSQIDSEVATYKKQYILKLVSGAIFGYLIIGAGVTAAASALLTRRNS
jgi:energy-coupling factor transporter transmembrane protein EcfT